MSVNKFFYLKKIKNLKILKKILWRSHPSKLLNCSMLPPKFEELPIKGSRLQRVFLSIILVKGA